MEVGKASQAKQAKSRGSIARPSSSMSDLPGLPGFKTRRLGIIPFLHHSLSLSGGSGLKSR